MMARLAMVLCAAVRSWPSAWAEWARAVTRACRLAAEQAMPGPRMVWSRWLQAWVIHRPRPVQVPVTGRRAGRAQQVGEGWL
ncbi:hypothetical protein CXF47_10605 [Corynebacterium bovis]|nr:hypothetical protein CXF47_10605 [Corynebacterium bovis]